MMDVPAKDMDACHRVGKLRHCKIFKKERLKTGSQYEKGFPKDY